MEYSEEEAVRLRPEGFGVRAARMAQLAGAAYCSPSSLEAFCGFPLSFGDVFAQGISHGIREERAKG